MAGVSKDGRERAAGLVKSFEKFIEDNKDEITALQILYSRPYKQRLTHEQLKELVRAVERPKQPGIAPMPPERIWQAYEVLDKSKVRGSATKLMTDLVSLRISTKVGPPVRPCRTSPPLEFPTFEMTFMRPTGKPVAAFMCNRPGIWVG